MMNLNFKTENDNDMENVIETEPKTWHSMSATEPGGVDQPQENAIELKKHWAMQLYQEE